MKQTSLVLSMGLFVVLGGPLVWLVWEAVNSLLTGHPGEVRWTLTLGAVALLGALLTYLSRSTSRLGGADAD